MTREDILAKWDTMQPRERDAWVGKTIMAGHGCEAKVLPYTTDITTAFRLVAEMERRYGLAGHNNFLLIREDGGPWYAEFSQPSWEDAHGEIAAEAIVKAALLAVYEQSRQSDLTFGGV